MLLNDCQPIPSLISPEVSSHPCSSPRCMPIHLRLVYAEEQMASETPDFLLIAARSLPIGPAPEFPYVRATLRNQCGLTDLILNPSVQGDSQACPPH